MADAAHDAHDAAARLAAVVSTPLRQLGLALYDVEITGSGRGRTLRVLVERARDAGAAGVDGAGPEGIDLEAITAATEALGPVLDDDPTVARILPGPYLLEVSSPGLERRLRTVAHFRGALGAPISLKSREGDGTTRRRRVVLLDADEEGIEVDDGGVRTRVRYADIVQARTVFEWGPAAKPRKDARQASGASSGRNVPATG